MVTRDRHYLDLKLRHDLPTFIHRAFQTIAPGQPYRRNWHIEAIAWHLEQCARGVTKRLVITVPPRSLKSICASVAFVAWLLGRDPSAPLLDLGRRNPDWTRRQPHRVICASYSADLAGKHALDCRAVMESDWYRRVFPRTRISREYSRLDNKREDVIILIMQRLHVEDLAGYVLQKEPWVHLNLPAIAEVEQTISIGRNESYTRRVVQEAREPLQVLDQLKIALGSFNFSAQYQQCPTPPEGEIIHWEWFRVYDELPRRAAGDLIVQSWDTASKAGEINDYSVCTTWLMKGNDFYLIDVLRRRLNYPDLKRLVTDHGNSFSADVIVIEDKGSGTALIQDIRREGDRRVRYPISFEPEGDKVTRLYAQSAKIEAGHVLLPRRAEWLDDLRLELLQFPSQANLAGLQVQREHLDSIAVAPAVAKGAADQKNEMPYLSLLFSGRAHSNGADGKRRPSPGLFSPKSNFLFIARNSLFSSRGFCRKSLKL